MLKRFRIEAEAPTKAEVTIELDEAVFSFIESLHLPKAGRWETVDDVISVKRIFSNGQAVSLGYQGRRVLHYRTEG